jgi:hypothetical protein
MRAISNRFALLLYKQQLSFPAAARGLKPLGLGLD